VALRAAFAGRFAGALAKACSWLYSYSCERLARFARGLFAQSISKSYADKPFAVANKA